MKARSSNFIVRTKCGRTLWYMVLIELMRNLDYITCQDVDEGYVPPGN